MEHKAPESRTKIAIKTILFFLCIGWSILAGLFIWRFVSAKTDAINIAHQKGAQINKQAAAKIDTYIKALIQTAHTLAVDLAIDKLSSDKIADRLSKKPANINGLGIIFAPYAHDQKSNLYAPYYVDQGKEHKLLFLEKIHDYTTADSHRIPTEEKASFKNPFVDPATNTLVIEYSEPFFDKNNKFLGRVFANYSLATMQELVEQAYPGNLGHGSIDANTGIFITYPIKLFVEQGKPAQQYAREFNKNDLANKLENALSGKIDNFEEDYDWLTGQRSWSFFTPIAQAPWYSVGVFSISELMGDITPLNRKLIDAVLGFIIFVIFWLSFFLGFYWQSPNKLWIISTITALGFIISIAFLWHNAYAKIPVYQTNQIIEKSSFDVQKIIEQFNVSSYRLGQENAQSITFSQIPTGIYIHQLTVEVDKIRLIGYVWQLIPTNSSKKITPGVIFPQATDITMQQIYTFNNEDWQTIGWSVQCTLQQNFNYSNYPFDFRYMKIALWPKTFDNDLLLVPDLNGYPIITPVGLPGINSQINQQDWHFNLSYFTYRPTNFLTNFGYHSMDPYSVHETQESTPLPELNFDIIANRRLISTLVLNLTPIIIILSLLFILLAMASFMEFSNMFGILASLFFTALIAYTAFKAYLPIQQIVFFDYLYFTVQAVILAIAIITILYYSKINIGFITHKDMLIPQLLFWPIVTAAICIMSLIFFY